MSVLVQFDGAELHIWHAPEPFFRIAACDSFRVSVDKNQQRRSINLPNGAWIETDDKLAGNLVSHFGEANARVYKWWHRSPWILVLLTGIAVLFGIWVLSHTGIVPPPG